MIAAQAFRSTLVFEKKIELFNQMRLHRRLKKQRLGTVRLLCPPGSLLGRALKTVPPLFRISYLAVLAFDQQKPFEDYNTVSSVV
jgi:hypothetical protein